MNAGKQHVADELNSCANYSLLTVRVFQADAAKAGRILLPGNFFASCIYFHKQKGGKVKNNFFFWVRIVFWFVSQANIKMKVFLKRIEEVLPSNFVLFLFLNKNKIK